MNERIGELLVKEDLLSAEQLRKAREEARTGGGRLGAQITELGFLEESELSDFVAKQYGVPGIDLDEFEGHVHAINREGVEVPVTAIYSRSDGIVGWRAAIDRLVSYPFPGNVRELMNICERLVVMTDTELIDVSDLPRAVVMGSDDGSSAVTINWPDIMSMGQIIESVERAVLIEASKSCRSQQEVAAALDMSQPTVARKLQKYGVVIGRTGEA